MTETVTKGDDEIKRNSENTQIKKNVDSHLFDWKKRTICWLMKTDPDLSGLN